MPLTYSIDFASARLYGLDRVYIYEDNWGCDIGAYSDPIIDGKTPSLSFMIKDSIAALAVAPESTAKSIILHVGGAKPYNTVLTLDAPHIGDIPSSKNASTNINSASTFHDTYMPLASVTPALFGQGLNTGADPYIFVPPYLALVAYIRPPLTVPTARTDYELPSFQSNPAIAVAPANILRVRYIQGRSWARVRLQTTDAATSPAMFSITGIISEKEVDLGLAVTLAYPNSQEYIIDVHGLDWILIKGDSTGGPSHASVKITAGDD